MGLLNKISAVVHKRIITLLVLFCVVWMLSACTGNSRTEVSSSAVTNEQEDVESEEAEQNPDEEQEPEEPEEPEQPKEEVSKEYALIELFDMTVADIIELYGDDLRINVTPGVEGDVMSVESPAFPGCYFYPSEWGNPFDRNVFLSSGFSYMVSLGEGNLFEQLPAGCTWPELQSFLEAEGIPADAPTPEAYQGQTLYYTEFLYDNIGISCIWFDDPATSGCYQITISRIEP